MIVILSLNSTPDYGLPAILASWLGVITPLLGRTQYCLGAVVLTLKITVLLVGFLRLRLEVTTSMNGPADRWQCVNVSAGGSVCEHVLVVSVCECRW